VRVHYIKSNFHRVIHADGAIGAPSPHLQLAISFWNERHPIPQEIVMGVREDSVLVEELANRRVIRDGLVREVATTVILDLRTAASPHQWLGEKIELLRKQMVEQAELVKLIRAQRTEVAEQESEG
jgi:hypothetical protein